MQHLVRNNSRVGHGQTCRQAASLPLILLSGVNLSAPVLLKLLVHADALLPTLLLLLLVPGSHVQVHV
jgi:hypothetical protein